MIALNENSLMKGGGVIAMVDESDDGKDKDGHGVGEIPSSSLSRQLLFGRFEVATSSSALFISSADSSLSRSFSNRDISFSISSITGPDIRRQFVVGKDSGS